MNCELKNAGRKQILECIDVEGKDIFFRNFSGKEGRYNAAGKRSFQLRLPEELAKDLADDGWHIRDLDSEQYAPSAKVNVNTESNFPVKVFVISNGKMRRLDPVDIGDLDFDEIDHADLIINAYRNPEKFDGVSAYLAEGYFHIISYSLEEKYAKYRDPNYVEDFMAVEDDVEEVPFEG